MTDGLWQQPSQVPPDLKIPVPAPKTTVQWQRGPAGDWQWLASDGVWYAAHLAPLGAKPPAEVVPGAPPPPPSLPAPAPSDHTRGAAGASTTPLSTSISGANVGVLLVTIVLVLTAFGLFKKSPAGALVLLLVIGTSVWVYADARNLGVRRGIRPGKALDATPGQWFVFCLVFWIIFFPSYLATRPVYVARHRSNGRTIRN